MAYKKNGVKYLDGQFFTDNDGRLYRMVGTCFQLLSDKKKSISNKHFHKLRHFWLQKGDKITSPNFTGTLNDLRFNFHGGLELHILTSQNKGYWERYTKEILFD